MVFSLARIRTGELKVADYGSIRADFLHDPLGKSVTRVGSKLPTCGVLAHLVTTCLSAQRQRYRDARWFSSFGEQDRIKQTNSRGSRARRVRRLRSRPLHLMRKAEELADQFA